MENHSERGGGRGRGRGNMYRGTLHDGSRGRWHHGYQGRGRGRGQNEFQNRGCGRGQNEYQRRGRGRGYNEYRGRGRGRGSGPYGNDQMPMHGHYGRMDSGINADFDIDFSQDPAILQFASEDIVVNSGNFTADPQFTKKEDEVCEKTSIAVRSTSVPTVQEQGPDKDNVKEEDAKEKQIDKDNVKEEEAKEKQIDKDNVKEEDAKEKQIDKDNMKEEDAKEKQIDKDNMKGEDNKAKPSDLDYGNANPLPPDDETNDKDNRKTKSDEFKPEEEDVATKSLEGGQDQGHKQASEEIVLDMDQAKMIKSGSVDFLFCKICKISATSKNNFKDHLRGKLHNTNVEQLQGQKIKDDNTFTRQYEVGKFSYLEADLKLYGEDKLYLGISHSREYHCRLAVKILCKVCVFCKCLTPENFRRHVTGYKHLAQVLRRERPDFYINKIRPFGGKRQELCELMKPVLEQIGKEKGLGTPEICVLTAEMLNVKENDPESQGLFETRFYAAFLDRIQTDVNAIHGKLRNEPDHGFAPIFHVKVNHPDPYRPGYGPSHPPYLGNQPFPPPRPSRPDAFFGRPRHPPPPPIPEPFHRAQHMRHDDPDFLRGRRRDDLYYDRRLPDSRLDPDPLERLRLREPVSYLDPHPVARLNEAAPYLNPDPLQRIYAAKRHDLNEPYIDPDPLKRVLPSQKAAKKPVVIDYSHGSEKKSARSTANERERDRKDILNESKRRDNLGQSSSSYSSRRKRETTPPSTSHQPRKLLPFSKSHMERSKVSQHESRSSKRDRSPEYRIRKDSRRKDRSQSPRRKHRRSESPEKTRHQSKGETSSHAFFRKDRADSPPRRIAPRMESSRPTAAAAAAAAVIDDDDDDDDDEAQADMIAEMLLKMKKSVTDQDVDPATALKAVLSQNLTQVLLSAKMQMDKTSGSRHSLAMDGRNQERLSDRSNPERQERTSDKGSLERSRQDFLDRTKEGRIRETNNPDQSIIELKGQGWRVWNG